MIVQEVIEQLQHVPIRERLHLMEALLESLKREMATSERQPPSTEAQLKPFTVRQIDLGTDLQVDRQELYAERGL